MSIGFVYNIADIKKQEYIKTAASAFSVAVFVDLSGPFLSNPGPLQNSPQYRWNQSYSSNDYLLF